MSKQKVDMSKEPNVEVRVSKVKQIAGIRTQMNYEHRKYFGDSESNKQKSKTKPDMTITVEEYLDRHLRGQSIPHLMPIYDEDASISYLRSLTKVDKYYLQKGLNHRIDEIQKRLAAAEAAKEASQIEALEAQIKGLESQLQKQIGKIVPDGIPTE